MSFKERMKNHEALQGVMVTINAPSVSEMLSRCGFDWLWIDMEHAPLTLSDVQGMPSHKPALQALTIHVIHTQGYRHWAIHKTTLRA